MSGETPLSEFIVWLSNDPCLVSLQPDRKPMKKINRSSKILGMVIIAANVRGLPQGWYFITVCPATEANLKTVVEVNN